MIMKVFLIIERVSNSFCAPSCKVCALGLAGGSASVKVVLVRTTRRDDDNDDEQDYDGGGARYSNIESRNIFFCVCPIFEDS
jgi:hypothetical protein